MLAVFVATAMAACGDNGGGGAKKATKPKGDPIVLGLINLEGTPAGSLKPIRLGVEAAVAYINGQLNGVRGRPIKLETCITNSLPETSAACAHKMVERKVTAVIGGVDLGSAASLPILTAAGIAYLGAAPLLPADFTTNGAFMFDVGGMASAVEAAYAADQLKARNVAILRADDAPALQLTNVFVKPALLAHHVAAKDITVVPEKADAADLTPAVAAAKRANPDAIIVLFPPPACARIMQAVNALSVKVPMLYIGRCGDPSILKVGGAGAEGAYFFSSVLNPQANAADPDVRAYVKAVSKFGSKELEPGSIDSSRGFATTMTVYQRLLTLTAKRISPAAVIAAFRSATGEHAFMGHPYTCDGKQAIPAYVSVCNVWVRLYQFTGGQYHDVSGTWTSAAAALTNT